jgi:hypothetical protein
VSLIKTLVLFPDLLRYLLSVQLFIIVFLCAWTAVNLDFLKDGSSVVEVVRHGAPGEKETGILCREQWWDYVTELAEFVALLAGKETPSALSGA